MLISALKTTGNLLLAVATLALMAALWSIGGEDVNWPALVVAFGALVSGLMLSGAGKGLDDLQRIRESVEAQERHALAQAPSARIVLPEGNAEGVAVPDAPALQATQVRSA